MSYLAKTVVERSVKKRVRKDKTGKERIGWEAYLGTDPFTKSAVRITRASEEKLKKAIKEFYQRHQAGGDAAVRLTPIEAIDAKNALDALRMARMNISLSEAIKRFLDGSTCGTNGELTEISAGDAFNKYLERKKEGADRKLTISTIGKWVKNYGEDRTLREVTAKTVDEYLKKNYSNHTPKTYNAHLLYLKTFFNWCCKDTQKYLAKNPIKGVEKRVEPWQEPEYMKPEDVERLFRMLEEHKENHPEWLAYAIISFFCGSRKVEIMRMATMGDDAARISLEDETVRIAKGKGFQRGRRPRAFHIGETAMAWMKSFDFLGAVKKIDEDTQRKIYGVARKSGIPIFQNCGRHTFITYHVAAYGDPAKTQAMVGTSEKMRAENYCGLASRADAEAYFKIMPSGKAA